MKLVSVHEAKTQLSALLAEIEQTGERPGEWLTTIIEHHDLRELPVDLAASVRSIELPTIHADPVDRILIATAEARGLSVVTTDPVFARYGLDVIS